MVYNLHKYGTSFLIQSSVIYSTKRLVKCMLFFEVNPMSKKEQLLLNAAKIIFEEGIQKLTIDYLAERSNITKAGVFYHFDDKASLLLQMNEMAITHFE